jgi:hypothetical protein
MRAIEERVLKLTQKVCRLYGTFAEIDEAIESMAEQSVSAQFVKGIYQQLSSESDNWTETCRDNAEKHNFYSIKEETDDYNNVVAWTSRYFLKFNFDTSDPALHKINVFDSFNDKSM